jgi:periplasmic protein TonB
VREAVDRLIVERQRMDAGLPATVLVSMVGHVLVLGAVVALPMLVPREPLLKVSEFGFSVVVPRGGGGSPVPAGPPSQAAPKPEPVQSAAPPPPPKVLKPPTDAPRPNALPALDARKIARHAPEPVAAPGAAASATAKSTTAAAGVTGGRGTGSATPGLEIGAPGVGVPDGTESGGDWYIAAVTQKIWMLWNQTIKTGFTQPIGVTFTIMPDGSLTDVRLTQPSGAYLLDSAAQRAVLNAAPFGPFPRDHEQKPRTIQAVFRPTS